MAPEGALLCSA